MDCINIAYITHFVIGLITVLLTHFILAWWYKNGGAVGRDFVPFIYLFAVVIFISTYPFFN